MEEVKGLVEQSAVTLNQVVGELETMIEETQNLVIGKEVKPEQQDSLAEPSKIQIMVNRIAKATKDLERVNMSLRVIG